MEWREEGVLLAVRRHGETSAIIEVMTEARGRHAGIVRGGSSRKLAPVLQPGTQLDLTWRARLESHLGAFTVEPVRSRAAIMSDRGALAALGAVAALACFALPERSGYPALYCRTVDLLDRLEAADDWPAWYVGWELDLLTALGFGPDLSACAVSGETSELAYISPRTGRAVTAQAGADWADRLLVLPPFLRQDAGEAPITASDLADGLRLTGHFLAEHLVPALGKDALPGARERVVRAIGKL